MDEMNPVKIRHFLREHPDVGFPRYRHLDTSACYELRRQLAARFRLATDEATLFFLAELSNKAKIVPDVNAQQAGFRLDGQAWNSPPPRRLSGLAQVR
jgi:hypothetical protein